MQRLGAQQFAPKVTDATQPRVVDATHLCTQRRCILAAAGLALWAASCGRDPIPEPTKDEQEDPSSREPEAGPDTATSDRPDAAVQTKPPSGARDAGDTVKRDAAAGPVQAGPSDAGRIADGQTPPSPASDDAGAQAACRPSTLSAGDHKQSLMHGGRTRNYLVHVPGREPGAAGLPLVLDFHGYSRTAQSQKTGSGWVELADREGIVVVYPEGVSSSWNVGGCCGTAGTDDIDDVGFARALITKLSSELCIDARRVYASGVSNGAGISARMACDAGDVFSGVALVSSDLRTKPCTPARPVTEIAFRGTADTLEPYEGGTVGPPGMTYESPGARGSFELWKMLNKCTGTPKTIAKYCETYTECSEGVEVTLCSLPEVGHSPYSNQLGFDIAKTTWDAFTRVPLRNL